MKLFNVMLSPETIERLKALVATGKYPNMSEAVRMAIKDLLVLHKLWGLRRT